MLSHARQSIQKGVHLAHIRIIIIVPLLATLSVILSALARLRNLFV